METPITPTQTVGEAVARGTSQLAASGSDTARLDAELLLGFVLGIDRSALIAHPGAVIGTGQAETFESYLERRSAGEPVAYIRGLKEFYGVAISVDPRVLIPRPETEALVSLAIERVRADLTGAPRRDDDRPYRVWDVGTGSGAIVVAMAVELRRRRYGDAVGFLLSDVSEDALAVATQNSVSHGVADVMTFAVGDLTDVPVPPPGEVDMLVSNLPYIPSASMAGLPVAATFEPALALDGGEDGLGVIRRLLPSLPSVLASHGVALLEIGSDQAEAIIAVISESLPSWTVSVHADLSNRPRVVQLERDDG